MYNNEFNKNWDARLPEKLKFDGVDKETLSNFSQTDFHSVIENMLKYVDGVNIASEDLNPELQKIYDGLACSKQDFVPEEHQHKVLSEFFDKVIEEVLI